MKPEQLQRYYLRTLQPAPRGTLRVAMLNCERGKYHERIGKRLQELGVDIALLSECDIGMQRSGNVDTVQRIATQAGLRGHIFGLEFQELGLGNDEERSRYAGLENREALHGNAILSRFPFGQYMRVEVDDGASWGPNSRQPRKGNRMAIMAQIQQIIFVSTHLESRSCSKDRAGAMVRLCSTLEHYVSFDDPFIIGGDFNTREGEREQLFDVAREYGLDWQAANVMGESRYPMDKRLDWFFTRNVNIACANTYSGAGVSDHDMMTLDIAL